MMAPVSETIEDYIKAVDRFLPIFAEKTNAHVTIEFIGGEVTVMPWHTDLLSY